MTYSVATHTVEEVLGAEGELSRRLPQYTVRRSQYEMAQAVERAIKQKTTLLVEAGTGTGKTFAYLIPALVSGKKAILSTGTKTLQDQLFKKDLPLLQQFLPASVALLKGRSNYLCLHWLEMLNQEGLLHDPQAVADLAQINRWKLQTTTGDLSELENVAETSSVLPQVTSTAQSCLHQTCPLYDSCFVVKARRRALQADVVVVNHHLFFADMAIKEEGFGELLPGADLIVFDEAHQVPEIASRFFSVTLSSRQFIDVCHDCRLTIADEAPDALSLLSMLSRLEKTVHDVRLALPMESVREAWRTPSTALTTAITLLDSELLALVELLKSLSVRGPGLLKLYERTLLLLTLFRQVTVATTPEHIHWYETFAKSFSIHLTPLSIKEMMADIVEDRRYALVFTSATLTVADRFDYLIEQLGLQDHETLQLSSPFDFKKQSVLYLPRHMPAPTQPRYTEKWLSSVLPIITACKGRTFLLFTSHQAMETAHAYLTTHTTFVLFKQGEQPKQVLLHQFSHTDNAVLLGAYSFWEGVDVRGQALSCVVIDKLPFASPADPIAEARMRYLETQGKNPFIDYQLPQAVVALKQGIGRLIRDATDRGILIVTDPRLITRSYGDLFFKSLPPMRITRDSRTCCDFMEEVVS